MIPVFKIVYTITVEDGEVELTDSTYARTMEEARESIIKLMADFNVSLNNIVVDDCAIYGVGGDCEIAITVEQVQLMTDDALNLLIT